MGSQRRKIDVQTAREQHERQEAVQKHPRRVGAAGGLPHPVPDPKARENPADGKDQQRAHQRAGHDADRGGKPDEAVVDNPEGRGEDQNRGQEIERGHSRTMPTNPGPRDGRPGTSPAA